MVATRAQKRCIAESSNPLFQSGILQRVFRYLGPGHWLFLSTVSSLWRDVYSTIGDAQVSRLFASEDRNWDEVDSLDDDDLFTCVSQMTLYSSVFESPSRVRLAHESGLHNSQEGYQYAAGRHSTLATLVAACELGMQHTFATGQGASESAQLPVLQFLYAEGSYLDPIACEVAARRGDFVTLRWLQEHECGCDNSFILAAAASSGNIEMTAWIMQQPDVIRNADVIAAAARMGHIAMCEYLHSEQFPWASACTSAASSGHVDTLRWLHEHRCPWNAAHTCEVDGSI
jgi:hypothetical protein